MHLLHCIHSLDPAGGGPPEAPRLLTDSLVRVITEESDSMPVTAQHFAGVPA